MRSYGRERTTTTPRVQLQCTQPGPRSATPHTPGTSDPGADAFTCRKYGTVTIRSTRSAAGMGSMQFRAQVQHCDLSRAGPNGKILVVPASLVSQICQPQQRHTPSAQAGRCARSGSPRQNSTHWRFPLTSPARMSATAGLSQWHAECLGVVSRYLVIRSREG